MGLSVAVKLVTYFDELSYYREKQRLSAATRFWNSCQGQAARFEAILRHVPLRGCVVLDIGCGTGDLLAHACARGAEPGRYVGVDIVPEFVAEAKARGLGGSFVVADVCEDGFEFPASDWAIANGLFGHAQPEGLWWARYRLVTDRMWRSVRCGLALTLVSRFSPSRNTEAHYTDPAEMIRDATDRFSSSLILDHTYLKNDMLLIVRKVS